MILVQRTAVLPVVTTHAVTAFAKQAIAMKTVLTAQRIALVEVDKNVVLTLQKVMVNAVQ